MTILEFLTMLAKIWLAALGITVGGLIVLALTMCIIEMRKKHYPRFVEQGKLTQFDANYRLEVMQWVADTLRDLKDFELKIATRFDKDLLR